MAERKVRAIADFEGTEAGELSLVEGDVLTLLEADDSGWAKVGEVSGCGRAYCGG